MRIFLFYGYFYYISDRYFRKFYEMMFFFRITLHFIVRHTDKNLLLRFHFVHLAIIMKVIHQGKSPKSGGLKNDESEYRSDQS